MDEREQRSIQDTPTWADSVFCLFLLVVSLIIDGALHKLSEVLKKKKRKSLGKSLAKTKTEMMKFGFLSFLLTISKVPISKICINKAIANSFLPCNYSVENMEHLASASATRDSTTEFATTPATNESAYEVNYCEAKGKVGLISSEGILQLNIFISVFAVFHILYCTLTMFLGKAKMRRWKRWEDETQTLEYKIANDSRRFQYTGQTSVGKRHLKFWSSSPPLLWMVCFFRQFYGSVSKHDYFTLRNGFIAANMSFGSNFNFKKFLSRTYDEDFEKVVGIRFWIWIFSMLFIFLSAHEFYNYFWLPFIPLVVALLAGTKLQVIITKMCVDSCKEKPVIKGTLLVRPSDEYFWFHRPEWLLYLLQLILIQNSFQLAFFTWTWYEFGPRSCFNREKEDIGIRIGMGVGVQILCGYVTLPLYVLVTQMGSSMRREVFTENVAQGLKNWHKKAKQSLSKNNLTSRVFTERVSQGLADWHKKAKQSVSVNNFTSRMFTARVAHGLENWHKKVMQSLPKNNLISLSSKTSDSSIRGYVENMDTANNEYLHSKDVSARPSVTTTGSGEEEVKIRHTLHQENPKIITRGTYDGEISFGSSWKNIGSSRGIGEISSITEEDSTDILPE